MPAPSPPPGEPPSPLPPKLSSWLVSALVSTLPQLTCNAAAALMIVPAEVATLARRCIASSPMATAARVWLAPVAPAIADQGPALPGLFSH